MKSVGQRADRTMCGGGGHPYHPLPLELTTLWGNLEFQGTQKFHGHWPFLGHESLLTVPGTLGSKSRSLESKQWALVSQDGRGLVRGNHNDIRTDCGGPRKISLSQPGHLLPQSTDRFKGESMKKAPAGGGECEALTRSWLQSHLNHGPERSRSKVRSRTGPWDKTCPVQQISSQLQPLRLKEAQKSSITYPPRCHHTERAQLLPLL